MTRKVSKKWVALLIALVFMLSGAGIVPSVTAVSTAVPMYDYTDNVPASKAPPGGLSANQVPLFIVLGFDDNQNANGMEWMLTMLAKKKNSLGSGNPATYDGTNAHASFYCTNLDGGGPISPETVTQWKNAANTGHELGNHTYSHASGGTLFTTAKWDTEIQKCTDDLVAKTGISASDIYGFRAPYLAYNSNLFTVLKQKGLWYDCTISSGLDASGKLDPDAKEGANFYWPYTLDNDTPGADKKVGKFPGLWEMPANVVVIPPELRSKYGNKEWVTGLDWNMWSETGYQMTGADFSASLKYSLDQRLKGNRSPFLFGGHTPMYSTNSSGSKNASIEDRRKALEDFIDYALTKPEVRFVTMKELLDWMRKPAALTASPTPTPSYQLLGYVKADVETSNSGVNAGFRVEIIGPAGVPGANQTAYTGNNGFFYFTNVPASPTYTVKISKPGYLARYINNFSIHSPLNLGTQDKPVMMWAGDLPVQDDAINMQDIMEIVEVFNTVVQGNGAYNYVQDLNMDGAVNMSDIMVLLAHFNTSSQDYYTIPKMF
ncbi:MAG: polysaccharide deacetylase family protein [Clostridia bacterium]|nr:polysaccharide deacetylase family protein [Clostridia bacterium]